MCILSHECWLLFLEHSQPKESHASTSVFAEGLNFIGSVYFVGFVIGQLGEYSGSGNVADAISSLAIFEIFNAPALFTQIEICAINAYSKNDVLCTCHI